MSVATAGDVNGDGYDDLVVGALASEGGKGKVYVYYGSVDGLSESVGWTATGEYGTDEFGISVATAGYVNGDGYADLVVGAPHYWNPDKGKVYVYYGSASGMGSNNRPPDWTAVGEDTGELFGYSVATAGNVNGDDYDDLIVGDPGYNSYQGKVYVYRGTASGLEDSPVWDQHGQLTGDQYGWSWRRRGFERRWARRGRRRCPRL